MLRRVLLGLTVLAAVVALAPGPAGAGPLQDLKLTKRLPFELPDTLKPLVLSTVKFEAWMPASYNRQTGEVSGRAGRVRVGVFYESANSNDPYYAHQGGTRGPTVDYTGDSPLIKTFFPRADADRIGVKMYAQKGIGSGDTWFPGCKLLIGRELVDSRKPTIASTAKPGDYAWCYGYLP